MADLIDRKAALEAFICEGSVFVYGRDTCKAIVSRLMQIPSAEPEIIRCKDCIHYLRPHGCGHIDGMATAQEDGYCSYAERRTDG